MQYFTYTHANTFFMVLQNGKIKENANILRFLMSNAIELNKQL